MTWRHTTVQTEVVGSCIWCSSRGEVSRNSCCTLKLCLNAQNLILNFSVDPKVYIDTTYVMLGKMCIKIMHKTSRIFPFQEKWGKCNRRNKACRIPGMWLALMTQGIFISFTHCGWSVTNHSCSYPLFVFSTWSLLLSLSLSLYPPPL